MCSTVKIIIIETHLAPSRRQLIAVTEYNLSICFVANSFQALWRGLHVNIRILS